jgi:hypothetical protein
MASDTVAPNVSNAIHSEEKAAWLLAGLPLLVPAMDEAIIGRRIYRQLVRWIVSPDKRLNYRRPQYVSWYGPERGGQIGWGFASIAKCL